MLRIGSENKIELKHGLALAPMAGVTDRAFRQICAEFGAEYAVTEMVSAKALCYERLARDGKPIKTAPLCRIDPGIPTAIQLFGSDPEFIAEATRLLSSGDYRGFEGELPVAIDINMGCPVRKVTANGEGSSLMRDEGRAAAVVSAAVASTRLPVTVKIRAGWDSESINAPSLARRLEAAGAAAITVHARTKEQMYAPGIMPEVIAAVKESVGVPVFGNGDIFSADAAMRMLRETGCDGIAVARGAMGQPWIFSDIACRLEGREPEKRSISEIISVARRQIRLAVEYKGERGGVAETKAAVAGYIKGIHGAAEYRNRLINATSLAEVEEILDRIGK